MKTYPIGKEREKLYLSLIPRIVKVARECGYAIGVHGSLETDLDLIAMAWTEDCMVGGEMVRRIVQEVGGNCPSFGFKPHGREAYTIILPYSSVDGCPYIDISVMSRR